MQLERNGCYSSSKIPNGILNQVKSIQNGNVIIFKCYISPTCLNWKKMEVLRCLSLCNTQAPAVNLIHAVLCDVEGVTQARGC